MASMTSSPDLTMSADRADLFPEHDSPGSINERALRSRFDGIRASLGEIEPGTVGHRTLSVYLERHERWVEGNNECAEEKENLPVPSPLRYHARILPRVPRVRVSCEERKIMNNDNFSKRIDKNSAKKVRFEDVEDKNENLFNESIIEEILKAVVNETVKKTSSTETPAPTPRKERKISLVRKTTFKTPLKAKRSIRRERLFGTLIQSSEDYESIRINRSLIEAREEEVCKMESQSIEDFESESRPSPSISPIDHSLDIALSQSIVLNRSIDEEACEMEEQ